jgi:hypothetical protein
MAGLPDMQELSPLRAESGKEIAASVLYEKKLEPRRARRFTKDARQSYPW